MDNKNRSKGGFKKGKRFQKPQFDRKNFSNNPAKKPYRHLDQVTEDEVGICEFLSDLPGFTGVIKARYSDFHVSEVDLNGEIAVLTNTDIPKEEKSNVNFDSIDESPVETLPLNIWNDIKEMVKTGSKEPIKFDVSSLNKEERTTLHTKIKEIFGKKIDSNTVDEDNKKIVIFKKLTQGGYHFISFSFYIHKLYWILIC